MDHISQRELTGQHFIGAGRAFSVVNTKGGRGVALGVQIDDEHPVPGLSYGCRDVHRARGFAHATLLVGNGDDSRHVGHPRPTDVVSRETSLAGVSRETSVGSGVAAGHPKPTLVSGRGDVVTASLCRTSNPCDDSRQGVDQAGTAHHHGEVD